MPHAHAQRRGLSPSLALALSILAAACSSGKSAAPPPTPATFTVHYHRALADYAGWTVATTAGAEEASQASSGTDAFGAVYTLTLRSGATSLAFTLVNGAGSDAAGALTVNLSGGAREAWVLSGWPEARTSAPSVLPAAGQVVVYYARPDQTYSGWGLHLWGERVTETSWGVPLAYGAVDASYGAGFAFTLRTGGARGNCPAGMVCLIAHKGDTKDPGPDMSFDPAVLGNIVFLTSGSTTLTSAPVPPGAVSIAGAAAHLLARDTLAWDVTDTEAVTFELRTSPTASVTTTATDVVGGTTIALTPRSGGIGATLAARVPHLATWRAFDVAPADLPALEQALKGQVVAVARKASGAPLAATQVQTALALDDLYPYDGPLGVTFAGGAPTFRLWAPTAQAALLHVFGADKLEVAGSPVALSAGASGLWSHTGPATWSGLYYRYELTVYHPLTARIETVQVTDPYAANLDANGLHAQIVDLSDPALKPAGWDALVKPPLEAPEDIVVYESHIRDFSALDATAPAARRGRYLAFTTDSGAQPSDGMAHLAALASAGLTHVHLLPAFDIATIDEDPAARVDVGQPFADLCARNGAVPTALCGQFAGQTILQALQGLAGDSDQQQLIAGWMRGYDSFNWGYDPFHYGAPEGSYASTADGTAKILEFRAMVKGLSDAGLRTVMDVVYNHTNAAGLGAYSVLDKVVPGYYHRLDPVTGLVLTSSCCSNTATEHKMMGRLMTDTLVRWARDYKVDGFRFDLMGLHLKDDVLAARAALAALTQAADGVDGSRIYLYGEGWEMGEMQNDFRGVNANQVNMAGTGIGTFNDRLRDGVRGGGPFDAGAAIRRNQGFASGQYVAPNELATATAPDLAHALDLVKIGMAGGLGEFRMVPATSATGAATFAGSIGYNGAHAGYTQDPQECVNYVSAHDNQVLWDIVQWKLPSGTSMADRVRSVSLAMDVVALGQGVPFFHMGDDLLRSKSMDKNSYDSGDWFNRIDWSGQANGWKSGVPLGGDADGTWTPIRAIFADVPAPGAADIASASAHFQELLRIRKSTPLFRLRTKAEVTSRVDFLNGGTGQVPGVLVMTITDGTCAGADLDPALDALVVIVNGDTASHTMTVPTAAGFALHPVQAGGADAVVKTASVSGADFTVPARTTAVFVQAQAGAQGAGLPCNTR
ncbi:MAG: pullulanase-type alpha-1,6-glucosidase [Deltaproteobacteria bacterium]|nr:pullulanase-type alpha-1,6-glucosidase [Deltaproteobacteria bacterium]